MNLELDPTSDATVRDFETAVANGQFERVQSYCGVKGLDPNRTLVGVPPLHRAIANHDVRMVKTLYNFRRVERNIKNSKGQTAMEVAQALKESVPSEEATAVFEYVRHIVQSWEGVQRQIQIQLE